MAPGLVEIDSKSVFVPHHHEQFDDYRFQMTNNKPITEQHQSATSLYNSPTSRQFQLVSEALRRKVESIDVETCGAGSEDSFFVADLGDVYRKFLLWQTCLPRVQPFYAVKCNPDPKVLRLLERLGAGFDCASKNEIAKVLSMGASGDRIIYAHPCKASSFIRYAAEAKVANMTFDNAEELYKCAKFFPDARLFLRITTDDSGALCQLSNKYGAPLESTAGLLELAQELRLNVVGVSFHVGSGASDAVAFVKAIKDARQVFNEAEIFGYNMDVLDIGGGFMPDSFEKVSKVLNVALEEYFPLHEGVQVIAEPGRFFVAKAFTIATNVIARRKVVGGGGEDHKNSSVMIYLNDGVYGNMNCILFDHQEPIPRMLMHRGKFMYGGEFQKQEFGGGVRASVWGPTCDGIDCVSSECVLPMVPEIGDWMYFTEFGAYTLSASTKFNGFNDNCIVEYVCSESAAEELLSD